MAKAKFKSNKYATVAIAPQEVAIRFDANAITYPYSVIDLDGKVLISFPTCCACEVWVMKGRHTLVENPLAHDESEVAEINAAFRRLHAERDRRFA